MNVITKYIDQLQLETLAVELFSKLVSLTILVILFIIAKRIAEVTFNHTIAKSIALSKTNKARQQTLTRLMHNVMNYILYFFLIYWILSILGIPISSLLAGAGLAGVAIGLGAQGFLSDVVNGFFILFENQFDIGDSVIIGTISGNVVGIGLRTTQIRGFDGTLHYMQNRNITIVSNKSRGNMRVQIDIPIFTNTDLEKATDIIQEVNTENLPNYPEIVEKPTVLGPRTNDNGQLVFRVDIFVKNGQQSHTYTNFYRLYQEALLANNIQLPTINATISKH